MKKTNSSSIFKNIYIYINNVIQNLNSSKIFAGLMIIIINIGSKFVHIKISKSMEAYLKYTFSKQILVFAIAWMGTRDVYVALLMVVLFTILFEFILNEESSFCCLPETFTSYHLDLLENNDTGEETKVSDEEITKAKAILEKAAKQDQATSNKNTISSYIS
jgi:hypothetical protein